MGFHSHEAAVCLVLEGDCTTDFNPAVVLSDHPLRVAVEASKLDPKLLAPDLNALLDLSVVFAARADGVDLCDPKTWTPVNSLRYAGCVRYLSRVPADLLVLEPMRRPTSMRYSDRYVHHWSERRNVIGDIVVRLMSAARDTGVDESLLRAAYDPLLD